MIWCDVREVSRLSSASSPPPAADMQLTSHATTVEGRGHSVAVRQPGPIQAPEDDRVGKQGHVRGEGRDMVHEMREVGM